MCKWKVGIWCWLLLKKSYKKIKKKNGVQSLNALHVWSIRSEAGFDWKIYKLGFVLWLVRLQVRFLLWPAFLDFFPGFLVCKGWWVFIFLFLKLDFLMISCLWVLFFVSFPGGSLAWCFFFFFGYINLVEKNVVIFFTVLFMNLL